MEHLLGFEGTKELVLKFIWVLIWVRKLEGSKTFVITGLPEHAGFCGNLAASTASGAEGAGCFSKVFRQENRFNQLFLSTFNLGLHISAGA
jgi:hypothetical protein